MDFYPVLERIEAKLDRLISGPESPIVEREEIMRLTGTKSTTAMHQALRALKVKPYSRGKYRRHDILNAIAGCTLETVVRRKSDLEHEKKTEAQRSATKPNRDND